MAKLIGNLRITAVPASEGVRAHFEVVFVPYAGRLNTKPAMAHTYDELVALLSDLKFSEDDSTRYAGRVRSQGVILVPSFERPETFLRDKGLVV